MDIIKNPIVSAILAGAITYAYLTWNLEEKNDKNKKKGKKEKKEINLLIPLVVAIIAWFLAYAYFEYNVDQPQNPQIGGGLTFGDQIVSNRRPIPLPKAHPAGYKFVGDVISDSSSTRSFSLLPTGGMVPIPKELPDVLLRMD